MSQANPFLSHRKAKGRLSLPAGEVGEDRFSSLLMVRPHREAVLCGLLGLASISQCLLDMILMIIYAP